MIPTLTLCSLYRFCGMVDEYNYIIRVVNILTFIYVSSKYSTSGTVQSKRLQQCLISQAHQFTSFVTELSLFYLFPCMAAAMIPFITTQFRCLELNNALIRPRQIRYSGHALMSVELTLRRVVFPQAQQQHHGTIYSGDDSHNTLMCYRYSFNIGNPLIQKLKGHTIACVKKNTNAKPKKKPQSVIPVSHSKESLSSNIRFSSAHRLYN